MIETGQVSISNSYQSVYGQRKANGQQLVSDLPRFQTAVISGLAGQVLPLTYTCSPPAINCTWPTFKTLGVCASFHNATGEATRNGIDLGRLENGVFGQNCTYRNISDWLEGDDPWGSHPKLHYQRVPVGHNGLTTTQTLWTRKADLYNVPGHTDWYDGQLAGPRLVIRHNSVEWEHQAGPNKTSDNDSTAAPPWPEILTATFYLCEKTYTNFSTRGAGLGPPEPRGEGQQHSRDAEKPNAKRK